MIDHVEAFSRGGAHDETKFVTACNKCNARKNNRKVDEYVRLEPGRPVKVRFGEPEHWDGLSTLFVILASEHRERLTPSERGRLRALVAAGA